MIKLAIISQKGGAGKTTLAINLAVEAERNNSQSLLIDLDPQSSATEWYDSREQNTPLVLSLHASRLNKTIQEAEENSADFIFIDTAPHSENAALEAAKIADLVLIPCRAGILDIKAIQSSLNICRLANKESLVILNALPTQQTVVNEAKIAIEAIGGKVCKHNIGQRIAFSYAMTAGLGVVEFDFKSKASQEIQAVFKTIKSKL